MAITMAQTTDVFEVDELVVYCGDIGGGSFYRRDKYIHLTQAEWEKLFSLTFDFENKPGPKILLDENALQPKFAQIEFYNGVPYLDIRHWFASKDSYFPTRLGVKIKNEQWDDITKWYSSRRGNLQG